ncbi:MAG: LysM peptidoglycan-binding domain-containing protein [Treponema sp.]|jgi:nucleoid-associated protein YgaU|nr:LysM peptidoglycan-binding domain-containing protein [Treponema sp.]
MKRRSVVLLMVLIGLSEKLPIIAADTEPEVSQDIRNNQYYIESLRLTTLAQVSFDYGDYDAAEDYAVEALRYAKLSDEYVALQIKIKETNDAIAAAKARIDWATSGTVSQRYPSAFSDAQTAYTEALAQRSMEEWELALDAAGRAFDALSGIPGAPVPPRAAATGILPARYAVRSWQASGDCFWNIAAQSWVYGDPFKWQILYNANKAKLPDPNNPNTIDPGTILDIPSIRGEKREGMYDPNRKYEE